MASIDLFWFGAGLVLLVAGGESLVRGASKLAITLGVSPLVVGLTVVAFGTSSPELAVSIGAALEGTGDIALGNVVGSNIANVLFILGLSAVVSRLMVARQLIWIDVPVMIAVSLLLILLSLDNRINRLDGLILVTLLVLYFAFLVYLSRRDQRQPEDEHPSDSPAGAGARPGRQIMVNLGFAVGGLVLLVLGANWLVDSARSIAADLGVSDLIIGLTVVAIGTSLPELATSIIAALRGQRDLAVGNAVGSNVLNILLVLGLTSIVTESGIAVPTSVLHFDLPVMTVVAFACLPIFITGHSIARWEGAVFLAYYVAYTVYLVLDSTGHDALSTYRVAMLYFVIPLTALTLAVVMSRSLHARLAR